MLNLLLKGGPVMWPLLLTSIITLAVVIERVIFLIIEKHKRDREVVQKVLLSVEHGDVPTAIKLASEDKDVVAHILAEGLLHPDSMANAILNAANRELRRFARGLSVLDTAITLAPLLGLLGTVTGLIRAFSFMGTQELAATSAITGGIAEALIATAFGLGIAITALIPFNYLNTKLEQTRHDIEDATTQLELMLVRNQRDIKE